MGYSGLSLSSGGSLSSTNLLYKENFLRSVRSRLGLSSDRGSQRDFDGKEVLGLKTQQDISWWETTTILCTHAQMLSIHAQAHTALAGYVQHPNEDRNPYEGVWSTQFHLSRNYGTVFNPRLIKYVYFRISYFFCMFMYSY